MSMQDTIADMITRINNAQSAKKKTVSMPSSKVKENIAKLLEEEGYIASYQVEAQSGNKKNMTVVLKYYQNKPVIETMKRVSRPGLRVYKSRTELPVVRGGLGVAVVSTSKGLMSDKKARLQGHGGEIICVVS